MINATEMTDEAINVLEEKGHFEEFLMGRKLSKEACEVKWRRLT
jgi:hypothetical protein